MAKFEGYERRIKQIEACLNEYGFSSLDDCKALCDSKGIDVDAIVKGVQPIAFDNATWAYTLGVAIALKKGVTNAAEAAETIGIGLQAFWHPRLRRRKPQGRPRPRQPRRDAAARGDEVLLLPRRT